MQIRFALWASVLSLSLLPPSDAGRAELARIVVSGCEQLSQGGVCEIKGAKELVIWREGAQALEVFDTGARVWVAHAGAGGLYRVQVRAEQRSLRLRFGSHAQVLQLAASPSWPWQKEIELAENVAARERLRGLLPTTQRDERAFLLYELARREYRTAQRSDGAEHLRAAAALAEELGRTSLARSCLALLANHTTAAHDFTASGAALDHAERLADPARELIDGYGRALIGNSRGALAAELAALPDAAKAYEDARVWVERGASELRGYVLNGLAMVSVLQGRLLRAQELYASLTESEQARGDACFRAITLSNLGWTELELLRANAGTAATSDDATRHLRASVESYGQCRATASWRPAHAKLSLAYDALRRGDLDAARAGIDAAGTFDDEPRMAQYRSLLAAEVSLAGGDAVGAAERFAGLHTQWQRALSTEPAWRALDGLGRALAAQQRWPEAIEQFEAAELVLTRAARGVPDPSALTSFFGTHDHSARGLREAYLATGARAQAFRALRRAQRRHLLALARDQRVWERARGTAWQQAYALVLSERAALTELVKKASLAPDAERAAAERGVVEKQAELEAAQTALIALLGRDALADDEQLRAPRSGELMVAWLRGEVYAAFGEETRHVRYALEPYGAAYLEPLSDWVSAAREVTVLSFSEPQSLDVHALPFQGAPLIAHVPVAYSLDLPPRAADRTTAPGVALLATDRRGNLVHAQRELDALSRVLSAHGWHVSELSGLQALHGIDASRAVDTIAIGDALGQLSGQLSRRSRADPELFYYAGHGRADDSGSLRSALELSDSQLTVADILALRAAPTRVVLSACEAARVPDLREGAGISIAQAFVMAGSEEVLAPSRPVDDRAAELLSARLREGLATRQSLAVLYQQALTAASAELDAHAFRRVVP